MRLIQTLLLSSICISPCWAQEFERPLLSYAGENRIWRMAFSPDGNAFAVCGDESLSTCDFRNGNKITTVETPRYTRMILYRSNEELLSSDGTAITFWNAPTLERKHAFNALWEFAESACSIDRLDLFPDDETIVVFPGLDIVFWNVRTGIVYWPCNKIDVVSYKNDRWCTYHKHQFTKEPLRFVTRRYNSIQIWEEKGGAFKLREIEFSENIADFLLFEGKGVIEVVMENKRVVFCDLQAGEILQERVIEGNDQWQSLVILSPDGTLLYSNHSFWEVDSGRKIATLPSDRRANQGLFSADGKKLALQTTEGVEVWDVSSLQRSMRVDGFMHY